MWASDERGAGWCGRSVRGACRSSDAGPAVGDRGCRSWCGGGGLVTRISRLRRTPTRMWMSRRWSPRWRERGICSICKSRPTGRGIGRRRMLDAAAERAYDGDALVAELAALVERLRMDRDRQLRTQLSIGELGEVLDGLAGETLQDRWGAFAWKVWPHWLRGIGRAGDHRWSVRVSTLVSAQAVRPSWPFLECLTPESGSSCYLTTRRCGSPPGGLPRRLRMFRGAR